MRLPSELPSKDDIEQAKRANAALGVGGSVISEALSAPKALRGPMKGKATGRARCI